MAELQLLYGFMERRLKMKNHFLENGRILVRYGSADSKRRLLEELDRLGIALEKGRRGEERTGSRGTRTVYVDIPRRRAFHLDSVTAGAGMASGGIRFYSAGEFRRLAETGFGKVPRFPVFHIPHDGNAFPAELMESVCVPESRFLAYHEKMRDRSAAEFVPEEYRTVSSVERFPVSRLLCDVERFLGPAEPMERYGMGFCYERAFDGTRIKQVTEDLKRKTRVYYDRHHAAMDRRCAEHPGVLILDLHSFSEEILPPGERVPGRSLPDVCIGTDPRYTPEALAGSALRRFREAGFSAERDSPYSGCFVPGGVLGGRTGCGCVSVMIEINRQAYLDGASRERPDALGRIRAAVREILSDCVELEPPRRGDGKTGGEMPETVIL